MSAIETSSDQEYCGTIGKHGNPCRLPAGWGTDHVGAGHCRLHLGTTRNHRAHAFAILAERRVKHELGALLEELELDGLDLDPLEVLAEQVGRARAMVVVLGSLVGELPLEADGITTSDHNEDRRPHVLVAMYGEWVERSGRLAKLAKDAGLAEHRAAIEDAQIVALKAILTATLAQAFDRARAGEPLETVQADLPSIARQVIEANASD